jgi:2-polyprenyl-3-methyl-5-hydroxy-6-metoxy-1,4-benzoquinol methylase
MSVQDISSSDAAQAKAFALRLFVASLGAAELMTAYLGLRLGLYKALDEGGPARAEELGARAGIAARYAREWLEQQAACGVLDVDDVNKAAEERMYTLPNGHSEVLIRPESPFSMAPLAVLPVAGMAPVLPKLLDAFRRGEGVRFSEYGADFRDGQAGFNRALFSSQLTQWIKGTVPALHRRLADGGARVAEIACGAGWASVALARAYPGVRVDGFDLDEASVIDARRNVAEAGVADRVAIEVCDAGDLRRDGSYDLVCVFDAIHDMSRPVDVLRACRRLRADDGYVLVMDMKTSRAFTAPATESERFMYAVSVLHCLPVGMADQPSAGTGAVMRPGTLRSYAMAAGFSDIEILPAEDVFHRLYRLME